MISFMKKNIENFQWSEEELKSPYYYSLFYVSPDYLYVFTNDRYTNYISKSQEDISVLRILL